MLLIFGTCRSVALAAADQPLRGYQPRVSVGGPTRLDWVFALANQSPSQPPVEWLPGYDSKAQQYELYAPRTVNPTKPTGLILFISASDDPAGLAQWRNVCDAAGILFASPYGAGNNRPGPERTRIVFDVLDDVRRRFVVDPDRTYLGGFSGGARVACRIAFALPEYFGGVVPVCAAENLREESWLRRRVTDRLSAALITGETDFNRGEIERLRGPLLAEVGMRTKVWIVPKLGHGIPTAAVFTEALRWMEEGLPLRRRLAAQWPAMRAPAEPATRAVWSQALLEEAKLRLTSPATLYSGLMQLQGVAVRWQNLPAAAEAKEILANFEAETERPWEADDLAEQRRFLLAEARGLTAYATGSLAPQYEKQRAHLAGAALERWQLLLGDDSDSPEGREAQRRIPELQRLLVTPR
jgi:predicted esterase